MALLGVALNLLANLWNALLLRRALAHRSPHTALNTTTAINATTTSTTTTSSSNAAAAAAATNLPPVGQLVLFWCARPRMAWMVVPVAYYWSRSGADPTTFVSAAVSSLLAELMLQLLGAVYLGTTVNYARRHGYYLVGRLRHVPRGAAAHLMYSGALLWLVLVGLGVLAAIFTYSPVGRLTMQGLQWLARIVWRGAMRAGFPPTVWVRAKTARLTRVWWWRTARVSEAGLPPPADQPAPPPPPPTPELQQAQDWRRLDERPRSPLPLFLKRVREYEPTSNVAMDDPPPVVRRAEADGNAETDTVDSTAGTAAGAGEQQQQPPRREKPSLEATLIQMGFDGKLMESLYTLFLVCTSSYAALSINLCHLHFLNF
jgi:hypothetical protein